MDYSNFPPGVSGTEPEIVGGPGPWEGRTCSECRYFRRVLRQDGTEFDICLESDTNGWMYEYKADDYACEGFEARP